MEIRRRTESHYGQNISSRSSSRRLEQVVDHGMRDEKGVHTIRDSYYHREKGAEKRGNGRKHVKGTINHQFGLVSSVSVIYFAY